MISTIQPKVGNSQPQIGCSTFGCASTLRTMNKNKEKQAFSERLIRAMRESPGAVKAGTKHGVDAVALQNVAGVSREMARRYLEGMAIPNPDPMRAIADWLNVRVSWLRDGDGAMRRTLTLMNDAREIAEPSQIYDPIIRQDVERLIEAVAKGEINKEKLEAALKLLLG